jgi:hypothetical protein
LDYSGSREAIESEEVAAHAPELEGPASEDIERYYSIQVVQALLSSAYDDDRSSEDNPAVIESLLNLGKVLIKIRKFDDSEIERAKYTLESGHVYGVVLLKQKKFPEAEKILSHVWDMREQVIGRDNVDTLESLLKYGNALLEQDDKNQWLKAEHIFSEGWSIRDSNSIRKKPITAYDTVLDIGYSLAYTLRKLEKYGHDLKVMQDVYDRKKIRLNVGRLDDDDPLSIALLEMQNVPETKSRTRKRRTAESQEITPVKTTDKNRKTRMSGVPPRGRRRYYSRVAQLQFPY